MDFKYIEAYLDNLAFFSYDLNVFSRFFCFVKLALNIFNIPLNFFSLSELAKDRFICIIVFLNLIFRILCEGCEHEQD